MRELLPPLLAVSANSPFLDRRDTGLHSVRTEIFTRTFPRCGVHDPFGGWDSYADFVGFLVRTGTVVEVGVAPGGPCGHHAFGTVEVRICDAQTLGEESFALAGLLAACVVQTALEYDEHGYDGAGSPTNRGSGPRRPLGGNEIEENLWRAIRHGMDGDMLDFRRREQVPTGQVLEELLEWTGPARERLGIEVDLPERNGAQRARRALAEERLDRGDLPRRGCRHRPHLRSRARDSRTPPMADEQQRPEGDETAESAEPALARGSPPPSRARASAGTARGPDPQPQGRGRDPAERRQHPQPGCPAHGQGGRARPGTGEEWGSRPRVR